MVILTLWIDTHMAYWPDYENLVRGGQIINAEGVINTLYEDFSALDFAREARFHGVVWDTLQDHTCGSFQMTILYYQATLASITARMNDPNIENTLEDYDLTETVERQTAEREC